MHACLDIAKDLGGFGILAHVDGGNGLETNHPGASPHKVDIICHPALLGIELKNAASPIRYSTEDDDQVRAQIGKQRIERLGLGERQYLARILSSDSHTLKALGRNATQDRRLTRYKMAQPSFAGLRLALEEGEQLIVFKSNSESSKITARGSIDDVNARDAACKILEGAREAFTRRARIYGIS